MLLNNLKIAFRIFTRHRLYGIINVACLSVASAFCLFAAIYVRDEFSYDKFHANGDDIYALYRMDFKADNVNPEPGLFDTSPIEGVTKSLSNSLPFITLLSEGIPELESLITSEYNSTQIQKDGKNLSEGVRYVGETFFTTFSFDFIHGDAFTALSDPSKVVITEEVAIRYFGQTEVLGKAFRIGTTEPKEYLISGVIRKPENSSISLNIVLRSEQSANYKQHKDNWGYSSTVAFLHLKEGTDPSLVEEKVNSIYKERFQDRINGQRKALSLSDDNPVVQYGLKNIEDLYLDPSLRFGKSSSPLYSYVLIGVALMITLIACLNYSAINISLINTRLAEVTIRKVVGSSKRQLVAQFFTETFLVALIAMLVGYSLMQLLLPLFSDLTSKVIVFSLADHMIFLAGAVVAALFLGMLAGAYPALLLAGIKLSQGLKGRSTYRIKPRLIQTMVVFQFMLGIFFIAMSSTMRQQLKYINSKDLGFDKEQVAYISNAWGITPKLKQVFNTEPSIINSVGAGGIFDSGKSLSTIVSREIEYRVNNILVDYDFFKTMGVSFVSGRAFDPALSREAEAQKFIVNERLYDIVKEDTLFNSLTDNVIGIVKDFHFESLNQQIEPMMFSLMDPNYLSVMYVKLRANGIEEGLAAMKRGWDEVAPEREFDYKFLDKYLEANYKDSQRWGKIIDISAIIAVIIACSGLFGLTGIHVMNRTKEIGIRKVLGANLGSLLFLLNKQTLLLILLASALSFPAWTYFSNQWLESYAYHVSLGAWVFILSGIACLLIVLLTVSFHGFRTSRINPAQLLRDE